MNQIIKTKGITFGLILGFILALMTTYGYAIDLELFTSYWLLILNFFIVIIVGILAVAYTKKALGGFITFKEAFTVYVITIAMGLLISLLVGYLIFNVVDPGIKTQLTDMTIEKTVETMERFNVPQENIDEAIDNIREQDSFSIGNQIKSYFIMVAIYSLFGLLIALILKRNDPDKQPS
jgi:ABC-type antimicrobial peptide transport system permease subunit